MDSWRKCTWGCGNCMLNVKSREFLFIRPQDILEWAHNVIDMIEDNGVEMRGIPLTYYITCTYGAVVSDIISPPGPVNYTRCKSYKTELLRDVISTLSITMILYSIDRQHMAQKKRVRYSTLSTTHILSFKTHTIRQQRFTAIHSMIDNISIVLSVAHNI